MTNNPTIDGVSLLPCPFCGRAPRYVPADYVDNHGQRWPFAECNPCNVGAPVEFWQKRTGFDYSAHAQEATIARLEARITQLESEKEFAAATYQAARDRITELESEEPEWSAMQQRLGDENAQLRSRIAELESGRGEPVAWMCFDGEGNYDFTEDPETAEAWRKSNGEQYADWLTPLFAAPPAPVAVVLPDRGDFEQFIIDRDGAIWVTVFGEARSYNDPIERDYNVWSACLDATAALNGAAK